MTRRKHCRKDKKFLVNFRCRGGRTIWNALRVALRIISGKNYFKFRNSGKSADFPELPFHGRGWNELPQSKPDGFDSSLGEGASGVPGNFALEPETVPPCQRPHPRGGCHGAAVTGGVLPPQKKAACRAADSLFQKKIRKTRVQKGRVSIRTCFHPCSARCARTAPTRLRSRRGRRCAPDT